MDADAKEELERIERKSYRFIQYFGVFWGAILVFLVQSGPENKISSNIVSQIVMFFSKPFDMVNLLGFSLLFFGVLYILLSLIFLIINAVWITPYQMTKESQFAHITQHRELFVRSVQMGLVGTIFLLLLFVIALMNADEALSKNALLLGKCFFWVLFIAIYFIDPVYLLYKKYWRSILGWINLLPALFVGITFLASQIWPLPGQLAVVFIWTFLGQFLYRAILSFVFQPFVFTNVASSIIPKIHNQK